MLCRLFLCCSLHCLFIVLGHAQSDGISLAGVKVNAYLSQSFIYSKANSFFGDTKHRVDYDYTELGFVAALQINKKLRVAGQLLYREAGDTDTDSWRLDYLFVDYLWWQKAQNRYGIRLGKITLPYGFYNESRDVAFTRPSILLPQSVYFDRARMALFAQAGVQFYGENHFSNGELLWKLNILKIGDPTEEYQTLVGSEINADIDSKISSQFQLLWNGYNNTRLAFSMFNLRTEVNVKDKRPFPQLIPTASGLFDVEGSLINHDNSGRVIGMLLSFEYSDLHWSIVTELSRISTSFSQLSDFDDGVDFKTVGGYFQLSYQPDERWEYFGRYDVIYINRRDKSGRKAEQSSQDILRLISELPLTNAGSEYATNEFSGLIQDAHDSHARDFTVGAAWFINEHLQLRAEYHYVEGAAWLSQRENGGTDKYWDLALLQLSYRF